MPNFTLQGRPTLILAKLKAGRRSPRLLDLCSNYRPLARVIQLLVVDSYKGSSCSHLF